MLQQMCGDVVKKCGTSGGNQNPAHGVHSARQKRTDVEMMLALVIPAWGDWRGALVGGSYAEEISTGTVGKARRGPSSASSDDDAPDGLFSLSSLKRPHGPTPI
jgi:hypothetical protein